MSESVITQPRKGAIVHMICATYAVDRINSRGELDVGCVRTQYAKIHSAHRPMQ